MKKRIIEVLSGTDWFISTSRNQTVFQLSKIKVESNTYILYNEYMQENIDINNPVSFVFVSKLSFIPKINETKLNLIRGIVKEKSRTKFKNMVENNGISSIKYYQDSQNQINDTLVDTYKYKGETNLETISEYKIDAYCLIFKNENFFVVGFVEPTGSAIDTFDIDYPLDAKHITEKIVEDLTDYEVGTS
jgi:hypothetical protein